MGQHGFEDFLVLPAKQISENITRSFLIQYPRKARVLQSFSIKVQPVEDGFVATSDISDVYELGETSGQAVSNYLSSLVDEIIWFQEHQESLSPSMLKDFDKLQLHIHICRGAN